MKILYTSDLHGETDLYRQLWALLEIERPEAVILGGDICPTRFGPDGPPLQRKFLERLLERFDRHAAAGTRFYFIFGNADCIANWDWLVSQARPHAVPLHDRVEPFEASTCIAGYSYVPVTPLALKDWEKRDSRDTGAEKWDGIVTHSEGVTHVDLLSADPEDNLAAGFARMEARLAGRPAICVLHSPPSDTLLDCVSPGRHVGSLAAREFILRVAPPLTLSGHIHESPRLTGGYVDRLGRTLCINPGQSLGGTLHAVLFDSADPAGTLRHTVFGSP